MSNYPSRYRTMLRYLNIDNKDVSEITGRTYGTVRTETRPNTKRFPKWAKLAVWVFEEMKK